MIEYPIALLMLSAIKGGGYDGGEKTCRSVKRKIVQLGGSPAWQSQQTVECVWFTRMQMQESGRPVKHGPYYQLSYTLKGKSSTAFVKKAALKEVRARMKRHKEFRELCDALVEAYVTEFRKQGIEEV